MKRLFLFLFALLFYVAPLSAEAEEAIIPIRHGTAESKKIALTFDDGPHPKKTKEILELLDEYDIPATFFIVGENAAAYPDIVKEEATRGHEIGNHTYTHPHNFKQLSAEKMESETDMTAKLIQEITGKTPTLFRPPEGSLEKSTLTFYKDKGYRLILWNVDTRDWAGENAYTIIQNVKTNTANGSILLFHDYTAGNTHTLEALKAVIPWLLKKGYQFTTVSDLLQ